ncbi:aliphatic sulfonate ABC transporter substrate-binding protein [Acetobacter sp. DsW_063]|uniref:aliphatic sulfonate ABC transporter substrate-binding protein n=1 Tax=Acetobacter sp. DsW_063 TaxID=1514894 RepID=UPI000A377FA3|nr:aliphatic sulfonate ABC transporter substrate-binding protein [Acetobacter sp. DsW_063]OUJ12656.1 alkane sulfonate ABC transporter substrate-bindnig protein [Acetobacter sp. DsW_063]
MPRPFFHAANFFLAIAAALTVTATAACAEDELVVADQRGLQKAVLQASKADQNLPYRVRWVEFDAAAPLLQALGAGAVDTGVAGDGPFLFAWGAGQPIKAAYWLPPRGAGHTTAVVTGEHSSIRTAADLSGKTIATGRGSIGHLLLLRLIQTGAIQAPAPRIVFLPPAQAKAALDSGAVDAWSTWEPYVSLNLVQNHGHVVADGQTVLPNNGFLVATDSALKNKRALLADFYRRVSDASRWAENHQSEYAAILSRQTGMPQDVSVAVAKELISTPGPVNPSVVQAEQATLDAYRAANLVDHGGSVAAAFITGFAAP